MLPKPAHEAAKPRRPLAKERVCLDCGRRRLQLMRHPLDGTQTVFACDPLSSPSSFCWLARQRPSPASRRSRRQPTASRLRSKDGGPSTCAAPVMAKARSHGSEKRSRATSFHRRCAASFGVFGKTAARLSDALPLHWTARPRPSLALQASITFNFGRRPEDCLTRLSRGKGSQRSRTGHSGRRMADR